MLEPLPIHGKVLKIPATYAIVTPGSTYFIKGTCQPIDETILCDVKDLLNFSEDECYSKHLHGSSGNCSMIETHDGLETKRVTDNHIIVKNAESVDISTDCQPSTRKLSGAFLIYFHNCSITLNNQTFSSLEHHRKSPSYATSLDGMEINHTSMETMISLEKLHEFHLHNREPFEELKKADSTIRYSATGILILGLFLGIAVVIWRKLSQRSNDGSP